MFNIRSIYLEWNSNLALRRNVINTSHFENSRRICRKKNGMRRIYFQSVHSFIAQEIRQGLRRLQTATRRDDGADLHAL